MSSTMALQQRTPAVLGQKVEVPTARPIARISRSSFRVRASSSGSENDSYQVRPYGNTPALSVSLKHFSHADAVGCRD